jgi:elongation factor Ts
VMVEVNCETDFVARTNEFRTFAHELALQIAANQPRYVRVEDVPEDIVAAEKDKFREDAIREGKPEQVIDRIVEGRMKKFYEDNCLLLQTYIRDDTMTVESLWKETISTIGENISIRRFIRWEMGEEV